VSKALSAFFIQPYSSFNDSKLKKNKQIKSKQTRGRNTSPANETKRQLRYVISFSKLTTNFIRCGLITAYCFPL